MLLATASTSGYSPVLMETAVVRGRLTELLGATDTGPRRGGKPVRGRHVLACSTACSACR